MEQKLVTIHNRTSTPEYIIRRMQTEKQNSKSPKGRVLDKNKNITPRKGRNKTHPKKKYHRNKHRTPDLTKDMGKPPVPERPCQFCYNTGLTHDSNTCHSNPPEGNIFPESVKIRRPVNKRRRKGHVPHRRKRHGRSRKTPSNTRYQEDHRKTSEFG